MVVNLHLKIKRMKKIIFSILLCISSILLTNATSFAQSKLVHYWHFNNYTLTQYTDTIHGVAADYSLLDVNKAKILYAKNPGTSAAYKTYIDSYVVATADYDTVNLRMSAVAGNALRVRNPSDSMKLYFYIPTTHFKNIKLTYASQSSSVGKGQLHQVFDYSVDSGITWKTSGLSVPSDSAWLVYHRTTVTFTTDSTVNNNAKLVFRITFNGNDTGDKGNNRFDNVTVEGDTILPAAVVSPIVASSSYSVFPNPTTNTLQISSSTEGVKTIAINSLDGKEVLHTSAAGSQFPVDVTELQTGVYFITIVENNTGAIQHFKFMKQ